MGSGESSPKKYCICKGPEHGFMICCDVCEEWFHGPCVGVTPQQAECIQRYTCMACQTFEQPNLSITSDSNKYYQMSNDTQKNNDHFYAYEAVKYAPQSSKTDSLYVDTSMHPKKSVHLRQNAHQSQLQTVNQASTRSPNPLEKKGVDVAPSSSVNGTYQASSSRSKKLPTTTRDSPTSSSSVVSNMPSPDTRHAQGTKRSRASTAFPNYLLATEDSKPSGQAKKKTSAISVVFPNNGGTLATKASAQDKVERTRSTLRKNLISDVTKGFESDVNSAAGGNLSKELGASSMPSPQAIEKLAHDIELALWESLDDKTFISEKYMEKAAILRFNLSAVNNRSLRERVLKREEPFTPFNLVRMSNEELAPEELVALRRKLENADAESRIKVTDSQLESFRSRSQDMSDATAGVIVHMLPTYEDEPAKAKEEEDQKRENEGFADSALMPTSEAASARSPFGMSGFSVSLISESGPLNVFDGQTSLQDESADFDELKSRTQNILFDLDVDSFKINIDEEEMQEPIPFTPRGQEKSCDSSKPYSEAEFTHEVNNSVHGMHSGQYAGQDGKYRARRCADRRSTSGFMESENEAQGRLSRQAPTPGGGYADENSTGAAKSAKDVDEEHEGRLEANHVLQQLLQERAYHLDEGEVECSSASGDASESKAAAENGHVHRVDQTSQEKSEKTREEEKYDTHQHSDLSNMFKEAGSLPDSSADTSAKTGHCISNPLAASPTPRSLGQHAQPGSNLGYLQVWQGILTYRGTCPDCHVHLRRVQGPNVDRLFQEFNIHSFDIESRVDLPEILKYLPRIELSSSRVRSLLYFEPNVSMYRDSAIYAYSQMFEYFHNISRAGVVVINKHTDIFKEIYVCPILGGTPENSGNVPAFIPRPLATDGKDRLWLAILSDKKKLEQQLSQLKAPAYGLLNAAESRTSAPLLSYPKTSLSSGANLPHSTAPLLPSNSYLHLLDNRLGNIPQGSSGGSQTGYYPVNSHQLPPGMLSNIPITSNAHSYGSMPAYAFNQKGSSAIQMFNNHPSPSEAYSMTGGMSVSASRRLPLRPHSHHRNCVELPVNSTRAQPAPNLPAPPPSGMANFPPRFASGSGAPSENHLYHLPPMGLGPSSAADARRPMLPPVMPNYQVHGSCNNLREDSSQHRDNSPRPYFHPMPMAKPPPPYNAFEQPPYAYGVPSQQSAPPTRDVSNNGFPAQNWDRNSLSLDPVALAALFQAVSNGTLPNASLGKQPVSSMAATSSHTNQSAH
ncbi:uncharacterized protein LOC126320385 isoform X2 [Schistocerca gregaria]|nr:uncharacterized protein LOC126320385 isoform X2 [Schistocerca gregaria]XP_049849798.1 uncharacterized protein LOC126320385 isoform X2 [Schistocerca gregaria]